METSNPNTETQEPVLNQLDPRRIMETVSNRLHISYDKIILSNKAPGARRREYVEARQICMYYMRTRNKYMSLAAIGYEVGGRNHATVLHSEKTVNNLMDTDHKYKEKMTDIIHELDNLQKKNGDAVKVCKKCGGTDIYIQAWIDPNTPEILTSLTLTSYEKAICSNCGETEVITQVEYKSNKSVENAGQQHNLETIPDRMQESDQKPL
jgi:hypothetical protein